MARWPTATSEILLFGESSSALIFFARGSAGASSPSAGRAGRFPLGWEAGAGSVGSAGAARAAGAAPRRYACSGVLVLPASQASNQARPTTGSPRAWAFATLADGPSKSACVAMTWVVLDATAAEVAAPSRERMSLISPCVLPGKVPVMTTTHPERGAAAFRLAMLIG